MAISVKDRFRYAWNVFRNKDPSYYKDQYEDYGYSSAYNYSMLKHYTTSERSIIASIQNRIAIQVSSINIRHVRLDENGMFVEDISSGLNNVLSLEANIDQTNRAFIQDIVMSMFDEGVVAVIPTGSSTNIFSGLSFDIGSMRTAKVVEWYPRHVRVRLLNDLIGKFEEIIVPKQSVAIIENPMFATMNEPNSTLKRLLRTLVALDKLNDNMSSEKLDMIIQFPYVIRTEQMREKAEQRRSDIEAQLSGSKYGIAYADGTERITQLNRPLENNLLSQAQYLEDKLYSELGATKEVFDGTADEKTMLNFINSTVVPILNAICDEFDRKFLTKTARTQGQAIRYYRDPFALVPINDLANSADLFTRNAILTSNEIRAVLGYKASDEEIANELSNKNLNPQDYMDAYGQNGSEEEGQEEIFIKKEVTNGKEV